MVTHHNNTPNTETLSLLLNYETNKFSKQIEYTVKVSQEHEKDYFSVRLSRVRNSLLYGSINTAVLIRVINTIEQNGYSVHHVQSNGKGLKLGLKKEEAQQ